MVAVEKKENSNIESSTKQENVQNKSAGLSSEEKTAAVAGGGVLAAITRMKEMVIKSPTARMLGKAGKAMPYVGGVIRVAQGASVAGEVIEHSNSGNNDKATQSLLGGVGAIVTDTAVLGGLSYGAALLSGPPGWIALGGFAALQGGSYLLTGKTIGDNVGDFIENKTGDVFKVLNGNDDSQPVARNTTEKSANNKSRGISVTKGKSVPDPLNTNVPIMGVQQKMQLPKFNSNIHLSSLQNFAPPPPPTKKKHEEVKSSHAVKGLDIS